MLQIIPKPSEVMIQKGTLSHDVEINRLVKQDYGEEGYRLTISEEGITEEGSQKGLFYADVTLGQLREQYGHALPCMIITDRPRFSYRGFMLDVCRHFVPVEDIKALLDAAAHFKLNTFHWHLTDDQGWRLESRKYPKLVEIGSKRKRANFGRLHEPAESGGYYRWSEVRDIIAYASERMIDVIPEIEIPGHATALLASYPEIGCGGEEMEVATRGGVLPNLICAGRGQSWEFITNVLEEIVGLFPCQYIHIGGDEACKIKWRQCPDCQAKIKEQGLKDENALQQWFVIRIQNYLAELGKQAIVWNDSLRGVALPTDFVVQAWLGDRELIQDFARRGGKIIQSSTQYYYLDYPYHMIDADSIIHADPVESFRQNSDAAIPWEQAVLGVEAPLWTERITNFDRACYQLFPRLPAVAENAWTVKEAREPDSFLQRYQNQIAFLEQRSIYGAPQHCWKMSEEDKKLDKRDHEYLTGSVENLAAEKADEEMLKRENEIYL